MVSPDVFNKAVADGARVYDPDAPLTNDVRVPLMRDNFGVCKLGTGFVIDDSLFKPLRLYLPQPEPGHDDLVDSFRYMQMQLYRPRAFAFGTSSLDEIRERWMLLPRSRRRFRRCPARKRRLAQAKLDRASNVRRRKRRAELARRRNGKRR